MDDGAPGGFTLAEQIACVKREISMRHAVYPGRVAAKKMSQTKAEFETGCMEQILKTLSSLIDDRK